MNEEKIEGLLRDIREGRVSVEDAMKRLKFLPFEDIGHTVIDNHRQLRTGMPEVVWCGNKTPRQVTEIMQNLFKNNDKVLGTRASVELAAEVIKNIPEAGYDPVSKLISLSRTKAEDLPDEGPYALVLTAGTSDIPVAEEAAQTLEFAGSRVMRGYDVGVAGIHRLFAISDKILNADVIICIAGMEGALASVVGGITDCPVIGVPTSVGYGTNLGGFAPLLTMLNSCSAGVAVVNIDNGFGAAVYAHLILKRINRKGNV